MINLLPYDTKRQIQAARTNTALVRLLFFLGCGTAFLALACITTYLFIVNSQVVNTNTPETTNSIAVTNQVNTIKTNLSSVNEILNQQISYKTVLTSIAAALPTGVVIDSLNLSTSSFGKPVVIQLHAVSNNVTSTLKENFSGSSLFSNFEIESAITDKNTTTDYPIAITIHVTLNQGSAK